MEINKDNLEKAVGQSTGNGQPQQNQGNPQPQSQGQDNQQGQQMTQEEEIGFHKGALNTLVNERNELMKMAQNVESVMQQHIKRLQELGVNIQPGQESGQQGQQNQAQNQQ